MLRAVSVDFPVTWRSLRDVVYKLLRCDFVDRDLWNSSFGYVYSLCTSSPVSHASTLYKSTTTLISERVEEIASELEVMSDSDLLPRYVKFWESYHRGLTYLDILYRYMNTQHVKNLRPSEADMCYGAALPMADQHTMEILEVGLAFWRLYLIDCIKSRLSSCLMREVLNVRLGICGQQNCIQPCLASFLRVGEVRDFERAGMEIYNQIFQNPLIDATRSFYSQWACQRESELGCAQYVTEALALRTEEHNRAMQYYKCSLLSMQNLFQEIIVEQRLNFLNMNVRYVIAEEDKSITFLFCFGTKLTQVHFIESLLNLRSRFLEYIDDVFDGKTAFRNQMDKAFNLAVNGRVPSSSILATTSKQTNYRPSELLCRYMDSLLRKSVKTMTISEIETKLTASIAIFKYIDDKDLFQKYYQRMLCKRLVFNYSSILELEESVINQLKTVCGYEFTSKFQRMFNDVQLSPELNRKFTEYLQSKDIRFTFGHHFHVLTQCSWPISLSGVTDFLLPLELYTCTYHFEEFYTAAHQGRKMRWAHSYSTVEIQLLFTDKAYQIQAPAINAAILLFFDHMDSDRIKVKDLHFGLQLAVSEGRSPMCNENSSTSKQNVPATDSSITSKMETCSQGVLDSSCELDLIQRLLTPLIELNIIYVEATERQSNNSLGNIVTMDSVIALNRSFTSKRLKLRVNFGSQGKESNQSEADQVDRQVNEDRRYFIQAAIVRILKARRQIKHAQLIETILQQASNRFQPPIPLIKRCIEGLIDTGYLERNPDDPDQYSYLA
ncbi:putative cullin-2 (cul-2) [Schistosoma mansoni]|uniref:putative cullin-2 (cul-2) n=1 Tax=Schistosoma mansoni TaxID=6183 RepID=UPI0001A62AD6|nr:putative cullin-2 (cul-2) [Schistosoma mansoni]|eukprot:XP_018651235.1 putative cullin-2 (cul-2) [Schistosoma mansoni]